MIGIHEVIDTLKTDYDQDDRMLIMLLMEGVLSIKEINKAFINQYPQCAFLGFDNIVHDKLDKMYKYLEEVRGYEF